MHRTTLRALAIATLVTFAGAGIALAGTTTGTWCESVDSRV